MPDYFFAGISGASARWVLLGGAIALGVPVVTAFTPGEWLIRTGGTSRDTDAEILMRLLGPGRFLGITFTLTLIPVVLSLLPAVSRACVRVKTFLPESLAPGWGLAASIPLFVLLTLTAFVFLYHVESGNLVLTLGLLLWVGAPALYLTKFRLFTRPVTESPDLEALARTQLMVLGAVAGGVLLVVTYLFTAKVGGATIVGFDKDKSMVRPWSLSLHRIWIEYVGRSLFLTVLFADLLVRMALSVWREERAFAGTEKAAAFDRTMAGLGAAVGADVGAEAKEEAKVAEAPPAAPPA